jgi:YesN/AraC family two-component response regulator
MRASYNPNSRPIIRDKSTRMVIIIKNLQQSIKYNAEKLDEDNQHKKHHTNNVNKTWAYKQLEVYTKSNIIFRRKSLRTSQKHACTLFHTGVSLYLTFSDMAEIFSIYNLYLVYEIVMHSFIHSFSCVLDLSCKSSGHLCFGKGVSRNVILTVS